MFRVYAVMTNANKQKKTMKRTVIALLAFALFMTGASAQVTERVSWRSFQPRDSLKLDSLYAFWNTYIQLHPKDENAWRNLCEVEQAKVYHQRFWKKGDRQTPEELRKQLNVAGRMKQAIPGTYTYYYCEYVSSDARSKEYADSAIAVLPKDALATDYDTWWVPYLIDRNDTLRLTTVLTQYFQSGQYPAEILQYNYNELQGMEKGGVYLGSGSADILGKLILQHVLGVHKDKILCYNSLGKDYLKEVFGRIGIPYSDEIYKQLRSAMMKDQTAVMRYFFDHSKQPVYLSLLNIQLFQFVKAFPDELKACLYNEGLTIRYSAKPYDNRAVKRRNVEQRYLMEHLLMSFRPEPESEVGTVVQKSTKNMMLCYLLGLSDLMPYYKKHNQERYKWLNRIFTNILSKLDGCAFATNSDNVYSIGLSEDGGLHYEFRQQIGFKRDPNDDEETYKRKRDEFFKNNTRVLIKTEPIE